MPRPDHLDLGRTRHDWRAADMPGANGHLDVVPLASATSPFSMLGRFPAGFERREPGGYHATEEFVVLAGTLWLDGHRVDAEKLVHVGAGRLRQELRAPDGCDVLVWFDGPPDFLPAADLQVDAAAELAILDLGADDLPLTTAVAGWSRGPAGEWPSRADGFSARGWASSVEAWQWPQDEVVTWRTTTDAAAVEGLPA